MIIFIYIPVLFTVDIMTSDLNSIKVDEIPKNAVENKRGDRFMPPSGGN